MIPHQPLVNRRGEPLPFLSWVPAAEIPPERVEAFSETHDQLAGWLFALLVNYGLRFTQETKAAFLDDALEPGAVLIRVPCAYFRCADRPEAYLKFDPDGWIRAAGFFDGGR